MSETFVKSASLIQWTEQFVRRSRPHPKSQQKLVRLNRRQDSRSPRWTECPDGVPRLILNRRENLKMTKTTKAMLAGAAFSGLIAGSGAAVKASTLLPALKGSFSAQEQSQDQGKDKKDNKRAKEKHPCKGQNSSKGKAGFT